MVSVTLVNGDRFLQLIMELNRRNTEFFFVDMTTPTVFEVIICFHCSPILNNGLQKETLMVPQVYRAGIMIGFCAQCLLDEGLEGAA